MKIEVFPPLRMPLKTLGLHWFSLPHCRFTNSQCHNKFITRSTSSDTQGESSCNFTFRDVGGEIDFNFYANSGGRINLFGRNFDT